jgi:hypothetical protein
MDAAPSSAAIRRRSPSDSAPESTSASSQPAVRSVAALAATSANISPAVFTLAIASADSAASAVAERSRWVLSRIVPSTARGSRRMAWAVSPVAASGAGAVWVTTMIVFLSRPRVAAG